MDPPFSRDPAPVPPNPSKLPTTSESSLLFSFTTNTQIHKYGISTFHHFLICLSPVIHQLGFGKRKEHMGHIGGNVREEAFLIGISVLFE